MSEAPEEQPTGVFGYIGSWFSPWRVRSPRSSTESTSLTSDEVFKSEGEEESEKPGKAEESGKEKQEESLQISKDILLCEGEDATQSAHRDGSVVSSTEATAAGGGPDEEESAGLRKKRTGQGKESSNGASESGNPEKNASHLTHLSSSFEQGVLEESDPAPRQVQARTGKRLHVYLEETSVICGKDAGAGQEVITKVKTSLQVLPRARSTESFDSLQSKENKRTNVKPAFGAQSYYSALVGVSLKSHKGSQSEPELNQIQTEEDDSMGRKNAARRRSRKNSQGDGGSSPSQQKMPPNAVSEGIPTPDNTVTSPQGRSPSTHTGETSANSSSFTKKNPSSQASPEGGKDKAPVTQLDDFQDSDSTVTAATVKSAMDGGAEMEEDDSLYKVERKTETPESKRRSIKVSRSEVKFFPKSVPLNSQPSPAGNTQEFTSTLRTSKEEAKDTAKTETDSRQQNLKKIDEEPKPVIGRIADKISLFERPAGGVNKLTSSTPRSADVSPVRKVTDKLKEDSLSLTKRARSAERYDMARSTSASPSREKPMTIKERLKNLEEASKAGERTTLPPKPVMTRMPPKPTPKPLKLDHQGKQDGREQKQTEVKAEIASKPGGQDTIDAGVKISTGEQPQTDSKTAEQGAKPGDLSPQTKGRTRSKRRKSKEPASPMSPLSPNSESKLECATTEQEVTAVQQGQVDDTKSVRASEQLTDEALPACDNSNKTMPDKEYLSDAARKEFKSDLKETKSSDFSFQKEENKLKRQGGLAEPSVSNKEPDTSACSTETKTPIDKEAVILPKQEEKKGGLTNEEGEKAAKDSSEMSASSSLLPAAEKPIEKEPPVEHPKLNKELPVQPEPKSESKVKEAKKEEGVQKDESKSKEAEIIKQPDKKDVGNLEKVDSKNVKQVVSTEKLEKVNSRITKQVESKEAEKVEKVQSEKTNQAQSKDKAEQSATKIEISDTGQCPSGTDVAAVTKDKIKAVESKEEVLLDQDATRQGKDKQKQATEPSVKTTSDTPAQTQHEKQNKSTHPQKADTHANETARGIKNNKGPSKEETATTEGREKETEPPLTMKPKSASVEKSENSLDDSCAHGANDATLPSPMPITGAATSDENVTVKASEDTPGLITAEPSDMAETEAKDKNPNPITASESVSSERERKEFKIALQEVKMSGEESKNTESTRDIMEKNAHMSSDSTASKSAAHVAERTDEKKIQTPKTELTPVVNGKIFTHPEPSTFKKETSDSKLSQSPKASVSQEAKKPTQDSTQRSPMKKLLLPRGRSKDDSVSIEDAPSSWLDVDLPKRRLKVSVPKLTSAGSESNLLDAPDDLDDNDFVERIKKLCAPFSLPPRRHNPFGPPQPPFAMPAIKEDRFEKTFDPEEFQFGLRKKKQFSIDTTPSSLAKIQNAEEKPSLKLTRASLADRSMLLSSLDTHSRLRDKTPNNENENAKEEKDDLIKRKSRLEGSCVLSSLTSSILRGKRAGLQTQAESTNSGDVSPSDSPQSSLPATSQAPPSSPTAPAPLKDTLAKQSPAPSNKEEAQAGEAVVSESAPPLPSFNDIKLPDYLEKYLPREAKPAQSKQGQEQNRTECLDQANGKMTTPVSADEADMGVKSVLPDAAPAAPAAPRFPGVPPPTHYKLPELKQPPAQPQGILNNFARTPKGFHRRPGKMVLFEKAQFSGQAFEIYRDLADATSLQLSPLISVKVVRGCWVLYEKPGFQGRCIALEEGGMELTNVWAEPEPETEPQNNPPMLIGSIRLAVWDYSLPHIDLFTEPEGRGRVTPYHDDTIETGSFGIPLSTASIQVHSGVWLVFSDPGFQGMVSVLERGVYPFPETWGFPSPFVGSIRPLKIGGFKVENPNEVKAIVFEKPGFEGSCLEFDSEVFSFCESEGDANKIKSVGSLKIIGGLWVGYSHPGFEGQQFILEEGEYIDCSEWGGSEQLLSLRPVLADFMSPHLKMFSDKDFGDLGVNIGVTVPIFNLDETGYGMKTQSIDVISGVWVVFEEPGFCSESYILEKGLYGNPEDWGALQPRIGSAMPVILDDFEIAAKFKVQLFSDPGFQGTILALEDSVASLQAGFSVASCKVLAGSWLAFEGQDFSGRMYVLEVGNYPDLRSMGCFNTNSSILSLQITGFEFSLPSITVFERVGLRGKRVVLTEGSVNLQLAGGCSRVQSVLVEGGMWVAYEEINYRGAQILLKPDEIHDWRQICSWRKIGSLRPLMQKQVHFRIRNRQTQLMMTLTGALDDVKLMRVQETEETGEFDQIWFYQNGHLHCKLLEECCLSPSGSVAMAGSRVGITPEPNQVHLWSITPEGFIRYTPTPDLVLEVKGGHNYDKNQVILNTLDPHKLNQRWDVEIL